MDTQGSNATANTAHIVSGTVPDTVAMSGGFAPLGAHVTFQVFAPGDTTCQTPLDWGNSTFSKDVNVSNSAATSPTFTTSAVGTYRWIDLYTTHPNTNHCTIHYTDFNLA